MPGIKNLRRLQIGKETTDAPGTAVNATAMLWLNGLWLDERTVTFPEEYTGIIGGRDRNHTDAYLGTMTMDGEATFEQLPYILEASIMKATPTAATPISVYPDDDILNITTLKTDDDNDGVYENTWAAADYITFPVNKSPLTWISSSGRGALLRFPCYQSAVQVVGKFGYCDIADVPKPVVEACYLQSHRIFKRMEAPFGVIGGNEMGTPVIITKLDGDVMQLINPYKRLEYA